MATRPTQRLALRRPTAAAGRRAGRRPGRRADRAAVRPPRRRGGQGRTARRGALARTPARSSTIVPDPDRSLAYWYYNGGKRSVVVDLDGGRRPRRTRPPPRRRRRVRHRRAPASSCAGSASTSHALAAARPALIVVSITDFGLTGPWADYRSSDLVALATSGLLITSGYDDHSIPPIRPGGDQAFHTAASFAHQATLLVAAAPPADRPGRPRRRVDPGGLPASRSSWPTRTGSTPGRWCSARPAATPNRCRPSRRSSSAPTAARSTSP